jgi:hypothetical protein
MSLYSTLHEVHIRYPSPNRAGHNCSATVALWHTRAVHAVSGCETRESVYTHTHSHARGCHCREGGAVAAALSASTWSRLVCHGMVFQTNQGISRQAGLLLCKSIRVALAEFLSGTSSCYSRSIIAHLLVGLMRPPGLVCHG